MDWTTIASTIGLSAIISSVISYFLGFQQKKKECRFENLTSEKERKYQHMLALMLVSVDASAIDHIDAIVKERVHQLNMGSSEYCAKELEIYMNYMYLYASDLVVKAVEQFNSDKTYSAYRKVARKMYEDLWK